MPNLTAASVAEVLYTIVKDIRRKRRQGVSVVSISWSSIRRMRQGLGLESARWFYALRQLREMDVQVVCAGGNHALEVMEGGERRVVSDTAPAGFQRITRAWALVVVGNCDDYGKRDPTAQILGTEKQVFAPGVGVRCASHESPTAYVETSGSSMSAALVAGVIAELLAAGKISDTTPARVVDYLTEKCGWTRRDGGEYVIWNQVPLSANPPVTELLGSTASNQTAEA